MDSVFDFFISPAWAQDGGAAGGTWQPFVLMIGVFVLFYFLLIRPQNKKQKEHRAMVEAIAKDDEIVTAGGVLGKVVDIGEQFITVQVADSVSVKVQRHTVAAVLPKGTLKSA